MEGSDQHPLPIALPNKSYQLLRTAYTYSPLSEETRFDESEMYLGRRICDRYTNSRTAARIGAVPSVCYCGGVTIIGYTAWKSQGKLQSYIITQSGEGNACDTAIRSTMSRSIHTYIYYVVIGLYSKCMYTTSLFSHLRAMQLVRRVWS